MTLVEFAQLVSLTITWGIASALFGMVFGFTFRIKMMNPRLSLKACVEAALQMIYRLMGQ